MFLGSHRHLTVRVLITVSNLFFPGSAAWDSKELVLLPGYLFSSSSKDFWVGLSMLLMALDSFCLCNRLLSSASEHRHLIDAVINTLSSSNADHFQNLLHEQARQSVFWPALQTITTLLDRLESRFWQLTGTSPDDVFKAIACSPLYRIELDYCLAEEERDIGEQDDVIDDMSCSQVVYSWGGAADKLVCKFSSELFSWILPFADSLLDYGGVLESVLVSIVNFICNLVHFGCHTTPSLNVDAFDSVPDFSMLVLSPPLSDLANNALSSLAQVVDLLFMKERYAFLLKFKQKWLPILTAAALLKNWHASSSLKNSSILNLSQDTSCHSSLLQSAKVLHGFISSSTTSLSQEDTLLFTTFLSSNFSSSVTIPSSDQLCNGVTTVLEECESHQDISGPFLCLQQSSPVSRAAPINIVKQELVNSEDRSQVGQQKPANLSGSDTPDMSSEGKVT